MPQRQDTATEPRKRPRMTKIEGSTRPEPALDLEADNIMLRAALANSANVEAQHDLITQELKHRIANLLAVVQAIARHTFKNADTASVEDFNARMMALAAAQTRLIEAETQPIAVMAIIVETLAPHCSDGRRLQIAGPDIALDGRRGHALTLALHELATNAAKYGALSNDAGWIEISWTMEMGRLGFEWREHNGPVVVAPERRGFGSILIKQNLGQVFGGRVNLDFPPSGLVCSFEAPAQ